MHGISIQEKLTQHMLAQLPATSGSRWLWVLVIVSVICSSSASSGYRDPPQRGCTPNLIKSPVNLAGSTTYQKFSVKTEFTVVSDVWFHLNKRGQYEINSDFGSIKLEDIVYTLTRLTFVAESETKLKGTSFPLEVQIEGQSKTGKLIVVSVLFRKSLVANPTLMKLGIGVGLLKEIGKQARSREKKVEYRFGLNSLFRDSVDFIRFQGSSLTYPCGPAEWLVLHHTLPINEIQIEEFPKVVRFRSKELDGTQLLTQNFDPNLSGLGDFEEFSIRKTKYFVNVLLDNHLPAFQFVPSPPVKPKPKPKKVRKVPTKEEIEREKKMKRAKQLMFSPFAIYEPKAGLPWGHVPDIAVMPWEVKDKLRDADKKFFLFKDIKVASPKVGYHYIPLYYGPTLGANIVDKRLVFIPYLVLVKTSQKELDVPSLGIYVWNIELQRQHFVRIRHTFGGKEIKVDRDLSEHIFNHPKPPVKKPVVILPKDNQTLLHNKWVKNETKLIQDQLDLAKMMAKEVNEIERRRSQNHSVLQPKETVAANGGFKEVVVPKHKTENELKIDKLSALLDEIYERKSVGKKVDFITNTFPLIESDPGEFPSDAVPVNKRLPANSVILNLKLPPAPVKDSKYVPLFFGPTTLHTRSGQSVWIPNFVLVPNYFGLPMDSDTVLPKKLPSYVARDPFWEDYDVKVFPLGQIALSYDKILADKSVLTLPYTETHHYMSQDVFSSLVEQKTRKPNTMHDILSKNEDRIKSLMGILGEEPPVNHSVPLGAQMLSATGRPHLDKEGKPLFTAIKD